MIHMTLLDWIRGDTPGRESELAITTVSEENRRYSDGENFHDRYNFYNARIGFILGERELLVVLSRREKDVFQICDISI